MSKIMPKSNDVTYPLFAFASASSKSMIYI